MANVIKIKNSGTTTHAPTSLEHGEIAINYADGILFYKDASNTIVSFNISEAIGNANLDTDLADLEVSVVMQTF
jgi:hypothetical protein